MIQLKQKVLTIRVKQQLIKDLEEVVEWRNKGRERWQHKITKTDVVTKAITDVVEQMKLLQKKK